jgi:penicillin amidase
MRFLRTLLLSVLLAILVGIGVGAALFIDTTRAPLPVIDGNLKAAGLTAQVQVLRDGYGVPHIYASNLYDLYFAQGFTQAQERWWQMEFLRHVARGAVQELTGRREDLLGVDIFLKVVGLYRAAERDYALLGDEGKTLIDAFAAGVNAYISGRAADDLAVEYRLLSLAGVSIPVQPWSPVDSIAWGKLIAWQLTNTYQQELTRQLILDTVGSEMLADYFPDYPYDLHVTPVREGDLPLMRTGLTMAGGVHAGAELSALGWASAAQDAGVGSNAWAATRSMTANGTAIFANDPHLSALIPSIWFEVGLHCLPVTEDCPLDAVGFTFSPLPGIIAGHNGRIAWGITNLGGDVQDLYRLRINPDNPLQYEWNGEWREMTVREEIVQFGDGAPPLTIQVRETHLGPIINDHQDGENHFNNTDPLALRWTGHEPSLLWESVIGINLAAGWAEFRAALEKFDIPTLNFIYADSAGNVGYIMPGRIPIRAADHDGQLPAAGWTDAYEWRGFVPHEAMPALLNPDRDYVQTANEAPVPPAYYAELAARYGADAHYVFGYQFSPGYRAQRIDDLLNELKPLTTASFQQIQTDNYAPASESVLAYIGNLFIEDAAAADVRDWLRGYDRVERADSPHAALYAILIRRILFNTFADQLPEDILPSHRQVFALQRLLEDPNNAWWDDAQTPDQVETRDDILLRSLVEAQREAVERMGADRSGWSWGALHTITFFHNPLGMSGISLIESIFNRGAFPVSGGYDVINSTAWAADSDDYTVQSLPSFRLIVDLHNPDASLSINSTGSSGHPYSPYYDDQIALWLRGEYKPLWFSRTAVENSARHRLILMP